MIELYGVDGTDIELLSFDINSMIVIVKDKINDITYKGLLDSLYIDADYTQTFSGKTVDVKYSLKISLKDYDVIKWGVNVL